MSAPMFKLRADPRLENVGKPWLDPEDCQLIYELAANMPINDIALVHKRTEGGIRSHIAQMVYNEYTNGTIPAIILEKYRITEEEYMDIVTRYDDRKTHRDKIRVERDAKRAEKKAEQDKRREAAELRAGATIVNIPTTDPIDARLNNIERKLDTILNLIGSLQ